MAPDELRAEVHNVEHHLAHAAIAFFVSPFDEAAVLTLDGFGDFASAMLCHGRGNRLEVLERVLFPHSLGIFYTAVTQWLGFPKYGDEGKVMGLAPYGDPERFLPTMRELVRLDGELFELELDYFVHHKEGVDMTWDEQTPTIGRLFSDRMEQAFGPRARAAHRADGGAPRRRRRAPGDARGGVPPPRPRGAPADGLDEPLPRGRRRAERRRQRAHPAGDRVRGRLRAAGGGRLRHRGRRRVLRLEPGARQPARLRDGARVHRARSSPTTRPRPRSAPPASSPSGWTTRSSSTHVAERIAEGDVVGWFQGRMEFGPRALGNRSIVVDPRRHDMKDILNARIKHRERVPPVRAVDPRRGDRRLVRAGLHVAVHGARLQDARRRSATRSRP